jgi:hypothetical protein
VVAVLKKTVRFANAHLRRDEAHAEDGVPELCGFDGEADSLREWQKEEQGQRG